MSVRVILKNQALKDYQSILFPYAYNIPGSAEDARDAVQDVLYKYLAGQNKDVDNEKAYLIKAVINQSINLKDKNRKVRYGDKWLPEPIATEETDKAVQLNDIAAYSLLILLEKLNPKERAVFILKEGFGYAHEEIAEVLSSTPESSRQLLSRARRKLDAGFSSDGKIAQINNVLDPQKLKGLKAGPGMGR
jgi:RNA polymerase sigma-70 factor (ECF subfamily)